MSSSTWRSLKEMRTAPDSISSSTWRMSRSTPCRSARLFENIMQLSKLEREVITDSMLKIQSIEASLLESRRYRRNPQLPENRRQKPPNGLSQRPRKNLLVSRPVGQVPDLPSA